MTKENKNHKKEGKSVHHLNNHKYDSIKETANVLRQLNKLHVSMAALSHRSLRMK